MLVIRQKLSTEDYKKALYTYYYSYKYTIMSPLCGAFTLLIMIFLWFWDGFHLESLFFIFCASLLICRPTRYVHGVLNGLKTIPDFGEEEQVQFSYEEDKILAISENSSSSLRFKDLYAYCNKERFLFLHVSKHQFMIIDKDQMKAEEVSTLLEWIEKLGIKKR